MMMIAIIIIIIICRQYWHYWVSLFGTDLKSELTVQRLTTVILNKSLLVSVSMN
jgi:hypothetical protein